MTLDLKPSSQLLLESSLKMSPRNSKIVVHASLSVQSEVFALTFYPHLLLPPVAAGYAAFFFGVGDTNFARGSKSGDTPVNTTHPETRKDEWK